MRPLHHGDVSMAARVLLDLPPNLRPLRIRRLFREAELADRHRTATGRPHPVWGTGSLMTAASRMPRAEETGFSDPDYCRCWIIVLEAALCGEACRTAEFCRA